MVTLSEPRWAGTANWPETVRLVADELKRRLTSPEILNAADIRRAIEATCSMRKPDRTFSIVALVWRPGRLTPILDHVPWCVFGVFQGVECEELFTLGETDDCLLEAGSTANRTAEVSGFAPPGDIHRVRNVGRGTAISTHIYGTDVPRIGSSLRQYYDLPVSSPSRSPPRATRHDATIAACPIVTSSLSSRYGG